MNLPPRVLGSLLLVGGLLLSLIIAWLAVTFVQEGQTGIGTAVAATAAAVLLLVAPQVALGVFLLRRDGGQEAD